MKKVISLLLALAMTVSLVACSSAGAAAGDAPVSTEAGEATSDYKIGIITGTVSQGEEEYQAAQNLKAKYGS